MESRHQKHSQNVDLNEIPHNLVVNILKKFKQMEGLRMRQTGRYLNALVQLGGIRFQSDDSLVWLALCFDTQHKFSVKIGRIVEGLLEFFEIKGNLDFLGCMTFTTMFVVCGIDNRYHLKDIAPPDKAIWSEDVAIVLLPILKTIKLKCDVLRIHGVCYQQMTQIMKLISFRKLWDHSYAHHIDNVISMFNEGRFTQKQFDVFCTVPNTGLLRKLRHFDSADLQKTDPNDPLDFGQFIRECRQFSTGRLRKFSMLISHRKRVTYIDEWPGCFEAWFGCISRFNADHVGQLHTFESPSKLAVIFTEDWEGTKKHLVYFLDASNKDDLARLTLKIIKILCPHIPINGSPILSSLATSLKAEIPFVLREKLNQIYSPPVVYPINVIRRSHKSTPDFMDY